jgi:hypothetical protein
MGEYSETGRVSTTVVLSRPAQGQTNPISELLLRDREGNEYTAIVESETFRTISVVVRGDGFTCGDAIEAEYGGVTMQATVWHAEERPDGSRILSLLWCPIK